MEEGDRCKERCREVGSNEERLDESAEEESEGKFDEIGSGKGIRRDSTIDRPGCSQYGPTHLSISANELEGAGRIRTALTE